MVREGQKRKNRGSSPKIDKSPQLAVLNNLNGSSPFWRGLENLKLGVKQFYGLLNLQTEVVKNIHQELAHVGKVFRLPQICRGSS